MILYGMEPFGELGSAVLSVPIHASCAPPDSSLAERTSQTEGLGAVEALLSNS